MKDDRNACEFAEHARLPVKFSKRTAIMSSKDPGDPSARLCFQETMTVWYEDEEFWRDNYEVMFSAEAFGRAAEDIDHGWL